MSARITSLNRLPPEGEYPSGGLDSGAVAWVNLDLEDRIIEVSANALELLDLEDLPERPLSWFELILDSQRDDPYDGWYSGVTTAGRPVAWCPFDTDGNSRRILIFDRSRAAAREDALVHQATHDALTGLPNRRFWNRECHHFLEHAERKSRNGAFLLVDLNRFKEVNDHLGHAVGDELLLRIARRLQIPLRENDLLARLGGDEFGVLLPDTELDEAHQIAEELGQSLFVPFKVFGLTLQVDASIGIALYPEDSADLDELQRRADVAMFAAKRCGRGHSRYHVDQDHTSREQLMLNSDLRRAIEEDDLELYYQPKICCEDGSLRGVEALLRWTHPERGPLSPTEFIAVAEHTGLIQPLSNWVLKRAIGQAAKWYGRGKLIPVSVNLSARNLQESGLADEIAKLLKAVSLPASAITMEITESMIMQNPELALKVMEKFAALGLRISIDDFGTGYSSLAYLKRLPAEEIKIDRTFISNIPEDREDLVIVRSTIEMAHNLGLSVVAEGVENIAIWKALRGMGCDLVQGFHFAAPLPAREFIEWETRWNRRQEAISAKSSSQTGVA